MSASDAAPAGHMPERVRRLPLRQNALRMDDAAQVARILERPVDALFLAGRGSGEEANRQKNEHADRLRREDAIDCRQAGWPHQPLPGKGSAKSRFFTIQRTPRSQVSSVLPRMSTWPARTLLPELASLTSTTKLRIRFDVFCTIPLTARSAPASRARSSTQPLHFDKGDLSCICAARDVRSTTCNCPESARSRRSSALASVDP